MQNIYLDGKTFSPSKVVCVGRNYVAHIEELGNEIPDEMVVFNKPNSAISDILRSQAGGESLHYESELCFLVKDGKLGAAGFGLDLTKRTLQSRLKEKSLPWERAKSFDGSVVFSQFRSFCGDIDSLSLRLEVDGLERQNGGVDLMMYKPETILRELRQFLTLEDGDVIMTGTPAGVGQVHLGERFNGQILENNNVLVEATWVAQ